MIDVMTPAANKGDALSHLKRKFRLREHLILVAGDGGNDGFLLNPGETQPYDTELGGIRSERHALIVGLNERLRNLTEERMSDGHKLLMAPDLDPSLALMTGIKHFVAAMDCAAYYNLKGVYEYTMETLLGDRAENNP